MRNRELNKGKAALENELEELRLQLQEANDTIEAIRTGQIDALVVQGEKGHQLYTLKTADQTYRVFIEKMTEGAVTLNREGFIVYCNSQFATMLRLPLSSVIGQLFALFVSEEDQSHYLKAFEKSWEQDYKIELLLASGDHKTVVQLSLTTLELEEGVSLSVIITDLTSQKETQLQLSRNNKELEDINRKLEMSNHDLQQFASVASHDLQEPLRKIEMFSNLLKSRENGLSAASIKYLDKIIYSSDRMKRLIVDILNYSRLSSHELPTELIDLNALITEFKEDFELMIKETKAEIIVDHLPCIEVNNGQMRQVFQNIISNALKFAKPGEPPVINIKSKMINEKSFDGIEQIDGPFCLICIKDNGIGFDEKYVSNVFTLFERLNSKYVFEGSGIGMAIAKKIIEKHNGLITASSKEGEGAEFKIILPKKQKQV